ncbi:MAG: SRPBCC family protein [Chloroflexota bacterium]|nr:SRPBCC family protein [Chloroflexota bacterium]
MFAFVADTANDPAWHTDLTEVRRRGSGPTQLGTEWDIQIKPFMGQSSGTLEVTEFEPNHLLVLQGRMGPMAPTIRYSFRAVNAATDFGREVVMQPLGLMRLLQPVMRPTLAKRNRQFVENLKSLLERTAAEGPYSGAPPA